VAVPTLRLGQLWRRDKTGENWLITKIYSEAFASYAVLRKTSATDSHVLRVKIKHTPEGVTLPGFTFTQEAEEF